MKKQVYWFVDWDCIVSAKEINIGYEFVYRPNYYYKTRKTAEIVALEMKKVHQRQAGDLRDFEWALMQLRKGLRVRRASWGRYHPSHLYIDPTEDDLLTEVRVNLCGIFFTSSEACLFSDDILANDWELYV